MTLFSSNLYKSENCTLAVYKSKPNIKVLLLSTKHTGVRIDNYKRIPEIITFYNKTKFAINAWILCKECTRSKISRKEFIFCLAEELTGENQEKICQRSDASFLSPSTSEVRKSCQYCYFFSDNLKKDFLFINNLFKCEA
ncbi:uncharacterized protein LOC112213286 isoform X1 [Bombus impatiens]|uniref:Uncharacterized protein LOC112213286 isoform X1 n=1 Tax=Bombus impatiens TaxID=132113 RepID=A0A6P8LY33_BOMIM|nr:uncharacterized protein LOC112213286 isoform X1 [Bombus impatiens]